jgi:hypothetical protein
MKKYADIHCHPSLHPYAFNVSAKKSNNNVWDYDPPKPRQRDSNYPEFSQSDFTSLAKAGVKLIYASLYPIEQGWFKARYINEGLITDSIAKIIARVPVKYINRVQSDDFNYFAALQDEYQYLKSGNGSHHQIDGQQWRYKLLRNHNELAQVMQEENTIGVINTIEGLQSLVSGNENSINTNNISHIQSLQNIESVKNWDFPPFFITMAHHFYNGYCGHCRSLPRIANIFLDQSVGLNEPINEKGLEAIDCLLGINDFEGNGRRILIDTKHMSIASRMQYYTKIKAFNSGKADEDKIPIIVSHAGYSAHSSLESSIVRPDTESKKYAASEIFNNWSINLSDEEIIELVQSRGMIGLNFDQRILSGFDVIEEYDDDFKKREIKRNDPRVREFWANQMLANIFGIVKAVKVSDKIEASEKVKVWDTIALGSDFDGMINPVDAYVTTEDFSKLEKDFRKLMPKHNDFESLSMGLDLDQIIHKIMFGNALEFAKVYFK